MKQDLTTLPFLDDCVDGERVQPVYRVRDSHVLVHIVETPNGNDILLYSPGGHWLQAPTMAVRAEFWGRSRDAASAREMAQWIRVTLKELDE